MEDKTPWSEIIDNTKRLNGKSYTFTVIAKHYLISAYDKKVSYTMKNKWRAMINMKLYAILYDWNFDDSFGIYYSFKANK